MPELIDLVLPWPVVSTLATHLEIGDLFHLSRVNSEFRAVLHGFPGPRQSTLLNQKDGAASGVRQDIFVGWHQNSYWKHLKSLTQMGCAETDHRKGYHFGLCRYCSSPVCDACIVRESFAQKTNTWRTRTRHLCTECWARGNPHRGRNYTKPPATSTTYNFLPGDGEFCHCTIHDGWLCSGCRKKQCEDVEAQRTHCYGEGCLDVAGADRERRSVCLWCDLPL